MKLAALLLTMLLASSCFGQSTEAGSSTSSGTSSEGPSSGGGVVCNINPITPPAGTVSVAYPATQLSSTGCTAPIIWSINSGSLPTGLSLSTSGLITGIPTVVGSSSVTITLVDNLGNHPIFNLGLSISASNGGAPTPPDPSLLSWNSAVANSPSPNTVVTVGDGSGSPCDQTGGTCSYPTSQLNVALGTVGCGQTLEIQNVPIVLPAGTIRLQNNCNSSNWITIIRDFSDSTFPAEGTKVTPCYAGLPSSALPGLPSYPCVSPARHMPLLIKSSATTLQFGSDSVTNPGASYIRFIGIQFGRQNNYDLDFGILSLLPAGCTAADINCMNHAPNHIVFDRCIVQGDAQHQTTRGFFLGGQWVSVIESYIYDIFLSFAGGGGDAQAFAGGGGKFNTNTGLWKLQNNFASASTMGCLFCGNFTEPLSPITNHDGVPHDIWWTQDWFWKNPLWDGQIGQALNESIPIEGVNYGPTADQEFIVSPSAVSMQQGTTYDLHNVTLNDSGGGLDRMTDAASAGSATVDGLACSFTTTNTVGTTAVGTTVTVASVANLALNHSILITGAASGTHNYLGTITNVSGNTLTISPATTASVGTGASVFDPVCVPGGLGVGDSTHGHLLKKSSDTVGSGAYLMQNIIRWTYIACSAAGVPFADCSGATTAGTHTIIFNKVVSDSRLATMGNNRTLTSPVTLTVTASAPTASIAISPSASDLKLQPSYPGAGTTDAFGNSRQFCMLFFEVPNYTQGALTWSVDGTPSGSSTVGTITSGVSGLLSNEAVYCSPGGSGPSPALNAGTASGAPSTDFDGISRGTTPSIGAYQQ